MNRTRLTLPQWPGSRLVPRFRPKRRPQHSGPTKMTTGFASSPAEGATITVGTVRVVSTEIRRKEHERDVNSMPRPRVDLFIDEASRALSRMRTTSCRSTRCRRRAQARVLAKNMSGEITSQRDQVQHGRRHLRRYDHDGSLDHDRSTRSRSATVAERPVERPATTVQARRPAAPAPRAARVAAPAPAPVDVAETRRPIAPHRVAGHRHIHLLSEPRLALLVADSRCVAALRIDNKLPGRGACGRRGLFVSRRRPT